MARPRPDGKHPPGRDGSDESLPGDRIPISVTAVGLTDLRFRSSEVRRRAPLKKVGEIRPSQFLFTYGIGSIDELPRLSVMVMGLDDWETGQLRVVRERRLLSAVKAELGQQVERLVVPPVADETSSLATSPFSEAAAVGVPVAPFPRWMHCPR